MSLIAKLLPPSNVLPDLAASSKKRLFEQVGLLFENRHGVAKAVVYDSLFDRERLGSTGLGQGVAIPHGRIKGLKEALAAFVRLAQQVPFDAPDGKPVNLVFALLVPVHATERHLNPPHQKSVRVIGAFDAGTIAGLAVSLFAPAPAAVIFADGLAPPPQLLEAAERTRTPLFTSPLPAARVIEKLANYLAKRLADTIERHGVLMDVLGVGVLITGDSGVGKSELALELISRGQGLVAGEVVESSRPPG